VSETTTETEDVSMPNLAENMFDASTEETVEEDVEETQNSPLTMKALSAADLIKKYS
jgi:hypothetical protein